MIPSQHSPVPRLVADTNIILGGIVAQPGTVLARLHERFRRGEVRYVLGEALLDELGRVFSYPEVVALGVTPAIAFRVAVDLLQLGEYHTPVPRYDWPTLTGRKDWFLLDLLFDSGADALVTQDRTLIGAARALGLPALHPKELRSVGLI